MRIICPASPARPFLRFAALAQPCMINDTIAAEMDARWKPPAGGPLVTQATRCASAPLAITPGPRRNREPRAAQPAQVHQAGRPGRQVRPSPAAASVQAIAQGASAAAAAAGPRGVMRQGGVG